VQNPLSPPLKPKPVYSQVDAKQVMEVEEVEAIMPLVKLPKVAMEVEATMTATKDKVVGLQVLLQVLCLQVMWLLLVSEGGFMEVMRSEHM